jgi:voltage-gated potassium channel
VFDILRRIHVKIIRYSNAIKNFIKAFISIKEELILFLILSSFLLFLSAIGIYYFENPAQPEVFASIFHSLWWAVATLTTVGYGDIYPITIGGKIFTSGMLFIGLGIIAVPTGLIASALTKSKNNEK